MAIHCIYCGTELPDVAQFCLTCGKPPRGEGATAAAGATASPPDTYPAYLHAPTIKPDSPSTSDSLIPPPPPLSSYYPAEALYAPSAEGISSGSPSAPRKRRSGLWISLVVLAVVLVASGGVAWVAGFHAASGSPTQTATTETLTVPFTNASGVQTVNSYSGLVTITVTGTGHADARAMSDAFYEFTSYATGQPITPTHRSSDCLDELCINGMPTDDFVSPIPPYQDSHQYTFTMHAPGGMLNFKVGDGYYADNGGAYTVTLTQQN